MDGANGRQVRKQGETLDKLQRQFATLESRFVDYQEAQAAMAQVGRDAGVTQSALHCAGTPAAPALHCSAQATLCWQPVIVQLRCALIAHANDRGVLNDAVSLNLHLHLLLACTQRQAEVRSHITQTPVAEHKSFSSVTYRPRWRRQTSWFSCARSWRTPSPSLAPDPIAPLMAPTPPMSGALPSPVLPCHLVGCKAHHSPVSS